MMKMKMDAAQRSDDRKWNYYQDRNQREEKERLAAQKRQKTGAMVGMLGMFLMMGGMAASM